MVSTLEPNQIRQSLSHGVLCLLVNCNHEDRLLTEDELEWAVASLQWINWHPGRTFGRSIVEGTGLVEERPDGAF